MLLNFVVFVVSYSVKKRAGDERENERKIERKEESERTSQCVFGLAVSRESAILQ